MENRTGYALLVDDRANEGNFGFVGGDRLCG